MYGDFSISKLFCYTTLNIKMYLKRYIVSLTYIIEIYVYNLYLIFDVGVNYNKVNVII
jgi:hypothetical protein